MKKLVWLILLLFLSSGFSCEGWADAANYRGTIKRARGSTKADPKYQKDLEKAFDLKLYKDAYYVHTFMSSMDGLDKEKNQAAQDMNLSAILDSKDVNTWNQATTVMPLKIKTKSTPEEILKDPKGSYVKMIMGQEVPSLSQEKVETVSDMDKQAIDDMLIMITESGTMVGAEPVPVEFKVE